MKILTLSLIAVLVVGMSIIDAAYSQETKIPDWIRTVAGLWASGLITDAEYLNTLQYLINNQLIDITLIGSFTPFSNSESSGPTPNTPIEFEVTEYLGTIEFSWNPPPNDIGIPIKHYTIEYFVNNEWFEIAKTELNNVSIQNLIHEVEPTFRIHAVNSNGKGTPSNSLEPTWHTIQPANHTPINTIYPTDNRITNVICYKVNGKTAAIGSFTSNELNQQVSIKLKEFDDSADHLNTTNIKVQTHNIGEKVNFLIQSDRIFNQVLTPYHETETCKIDT